MPHRKCDGLAVSTPVQIASTCCGRTPCHWEKISDDPGWKNRVQEVNTEKCPPNGKGRQPATVIRVAALEAQNVPEKKIFCTSTRTPQHLVLMCCIGWHRHSYTEELQVNTPIAQLLYRSQADPDTRRVNKNSTRAGTHTPHRHEGSPSRQNLYDRHRPSYSSRYL